LKTAALLRQAILKTKLTRAWRRWSMAGSLRPKAYQTLALQ
jgi:hypothetical protein